MKWEGQRGIVNNDRRMNDGRPKKKMKGASGDGWMALQSCKIFVQHHWPFKVPSQAGIYMIGYGSPGATPALPLLGNCWHVDRSLTKRWRSGR